MSQVGQVALWTDVLLHSRLAGGAAIVGAHRQAPLHHFKEDAMEAVNEVRLLGRLSTETVDRELPSGDVIVVARLVVPRPDDGSNRRQSVDVLECSAWSPRVQRAMRGWREGDLVDVRGAIRRRFFRVAGQTAARVEIEVSSGRLVRRADRE